MTTPSPAVRPTIIVRTEEGEVLRELLLVLASIPELWQRGGRLVQVATDPEGPKLLVRPRTAPVIYPVGKATLRSMLTDHCEFQRWDKREREYLPCHPPDWAVDALLEARRKWRVPLLEGITEAPVLLRSGRVLQEPGYDSESGLHFLPPADVQFPKVNETPVESELEWAKTNLRSAVCDFPFLADSHRAVWMAGLLSYFARWAYEGPTPLFLVDANTRGSGKTLLARLAAIIALGREPTLTAQATDDDQERRRILAVAVAGDPIVLIDNISRPFGSGVFDAALTSPSISDRPLYETELVTHPLFTIWWATGNNVEFRRHVDTARRTLHMRLESAEEKPENRRGFQHPKLLEWAVKRRPSLVWSALTLLRGFMAAGQPEQGIRPWGSFEGWSRLVRECVVWAGFSDPYEAAEGLQESADTTTKALADFLVGWEELCASVGKSALTVREGLSQLESELENRRARPLMTRSYEKLLGALDELCPSKRGPLPDSHQLGILMRRYRGRVLERRKLATQGEQDHVQTWAVVTVKD